ncbi:unnamed protein product [Nippostrongylus brasiliensis]|uniref:Diguanylate cyclase n=1 Tax=Nippostrongylus brasiliensis TaxID=27835 RepID=A0A158QYH1_NIPBR|nr:unnamed protein product [Nippostrongylus brasiliensis]
MADMTQSHQLSTRAGCHVGTTLPVDHGVNRMRYRLLAGGGAKLRNHVVMLVILLVLSWVLLCYLISREKLRLIRREQRITDLARQVLMLEKAAARMHRGIEEQVSAIGELTRETVPSRLRLRIQALQKSLHQLAAPRFKHRPETSHLDCARLIAGDRRYIANVAASRVVMMPSDNLEMNCEAIRWRVLPRVECVDEMLISTLQAAENWAMPGHFTSECARREVPYNGITRCGTIMISTRRPFNYSATTTGAQFE